MQYGTATDDNDEQQKQQEPPLSSNPSNRKDLTVFKPSTVVADEGSGFTPIVAKSDYKTSGTNDETRIPLLFPQKGHGSTGASLKERKRKKDGNAKKFKRINVGLVIERYDEIFNPFDPNPYKDRDIGLDFVEECRKRVMKTTKGGLVLRIMLEPELRSHEDEHVIKERLKHYYRTTSRQKQRDFRKFILVSLFWLVLGVLLMGLSGVLDNYFSNESSYVYSIASSFLQPCSWFTVWTAMDFLVFKRKEKTAELIFFRKMANVEIKFSSLNLRR